MRTALAVLAFIVLAGAARAGGDGPARPSSAALLDLDLAAAALSKPQIEALPMTCAFVDAIQRGAKLLELDALAQHLDPRGDSTAEVHMARVTIERAGAPRLALICSEAEAAGVISAH